MKLQAPSSAVADHPLRSLTGGEIEAATELLRREGRMGPEVRVHSMILREPPKAVVLGFQPGNPIDREVMVTLHDRARRMTIEALVSLSRGEVTSWSERNDV